MKSKAKKQKKAKAVKSKADRPAAADQKKVKLPFVPTWKSNHPGTFKMIPLSEIIVNKSNPRKEFDVESITELSESIASKGVIEPIVVRHHAKNGYELVCGERRFRASKLVKLVEIPAMIRQLTDEEALELMIIENLQRKDVHPMDEAAAFKQLIVVKKFDVKEIAKRIGRVANYVAGRLRLNELISQYQKAFYENRFTLTEISKLFKLSPESQKQLWNENHEDNDYGDINDYDIRQYIGNLQTAPFDLKDPGLNKAMGACTACPFNTASNTVLFPEAATQAKCMKIKCYTDKCRVSFDKQIKIAKEDPAIVFVKGSNTQGDANTQQLVVEGHKVLREYSDYSKISKPEMPDWEKDYKGGMGGFASEQEATKQFKKDCKAYDEELAAYDKKVASGKFTKAFVAYGNDAGKYVYIQLNESAEAKANVSAGEGSASDIKAEITRLQDNAKRKEELEREKITQEIYKVLEANEEKFLTDKALLPIEQAAFIIMLHDRFNLYDLEKLVKVKDISSLVELMKDPGKVQSVINLSVRSVLLQELAPSKDNVIGDDGKADSLLKIVDKYYPSELKRLLDAKEEVMNAYTEKLESKIKTLNSSNKTKVDLTPAKGKGLKALLPDSK